MRVRKSVFVLIFMIMAQALSVPAAYPHPPNKSISIKLLVKPMPKIEINENIKSRVIEKYTDIIARLRKGNARGVFIRLTASEGKAYTELIPIHRPEP